MECYKEVYGRVRRRTYLIWLSVLVSFVVISCRCILHIHTPYRTPNLHSLRHVSFSHTTTKVNTIINKLARSIGSCLSINSKNCQREIILFTSWRSLVFKCTFTLTNKYITNNIMWRQKLENSCVNSVTLLYFLMLQCCLVMICLRVRKVCV